MGRLLAIGDIHGCATALDALLAALALGDDDLLVTVGDYVDRGADSAGVLNRLIGLFERGCLVPILGNHDEMMRDVRKGKANLMQWLAMNGGTTLLAYPLPPAGSNDSEVLDCVPKAHWDFLEHACQDYFETDTHVFVHAGVLPHLPLDRQPVEILRWERLPVEPLPHASGKIVVCGHTRQHSGLPGNWQHTVCIDTGCEHGDWLTCLDVHSGEVWQSNEAGAVRRGRDLA